MTLVSVIMNEDAAHATIKNLGEMGMMQFTDLNAEQTAFQRRYINCVKRCDELERKLRYFDGELGRLGIEAVPLRPGFGSSHSTEHGTQVIDALEGALSGQEHELLQLANFRGCLTREINEKLEMRQVLRHGLTLSSGMPLSRRAPGAQQYDRPLKDPLLDIESDDSSSCRHELFFASITGVVAVEEKTRFERMVFRASRGNCFMQFHDISEAISDPVSGQEVAKCVFVIVFKSAAIEAKLRKICEAFHANTYTVPGDQDQLDTNEDENEAAIRELSRVLRQNTLQCRNACLSIAQKTNSWRYRVRQEKTIYHSMNLCRADVIGMLRAEGWVVTDALDGVRTAVREAHDIAAGGGAHIPSVVNELAKPWPEPPTYFETNKFTQPFQALVDTYGVPRYREINPALFTAVTFPFMFGVMYGDIGHGTCLTVAALYLIWTEASREGKQLNELMSGLHGARYMILLMGLFAIYNGFIYNDALSLSLDLFGSRWEYACCCKSNSPTVPNFAGCNGPDEEIAVCPWKNAEALYQPANSSVWYRPVECPDPVPAGMVAFPKGLESSKNCVHSPNNPFCPAAGSIYPFGIDPQWKHTANELLFVNSLKMKLSVILGITQMTFGIGLKGMNALYNKEYTDFYAEFVPQLVFTSALFVYMMIMIFIKWSINWDLRMAHGTDVSGKPIECDLGYGGEGGGCQPPSLISTLIDIALKPGTVENPMFPGQAGLQVFLVLMAFMSVPAMLGLKVMCLALSPFVCDFYVCCRCVAISIVQAT
jgi:V-type H+-transporting ATPase subunit a